MAKKHNSNKGKKINSKGGSGRGMKGVTVNNDEERPDCPICGGFMKSSGSEWNCTDQYDGGCIKWITKSPADGGIKNYNESLGFDTDAAEAHARGCEKGQRLILTSAQNNSEADVSFLKSLKRACKYYKCELAVIPSHYRNLTLFTKGDKKEFDGLLAPYLVKSDINFGNFKIKSDVRIQPTSVNPLGGKWSHSGASSVVFGHPQLCREPVAGNTPFPKLMLTTGSVTKANYSVSDAGEKGKFHHCNSAIILEKYRGKVFVRQLSADDNGRFYDLNNRFTPNGFSTNNKVEAINFGDTHEKFNSVKKVTFGKGGIVDTLKPKLLVHNDLVDGYAGSHHHLKMPMVQFIKHHNGDNDYRKELDDVIKFINTTTPKTAKALIVPSNHHDHLIQFLNTADANKDHTNALLILELQAAMREAALKGENYDPFYLYCKDKITCKHEFLSRNKPYYLSGGVDISQHGDVGTNGSRGSARGLAKTPDKLTIGHSHSARIFQGVYQAGTSTDRLEYERGLSDHSNSHVIQYKDGKRTIVDIYDHKHWRKI